MVGKTLSHYSIIDELGRGGMGIVYKAEDTKLDRTVAIKVLPSAALASEDDRARFYREAKAAAQLHHPHIASIFEIDEAVPSDAPHGTQPSPFIAMEFVEGQTLHGRIQKGPLKLEEAVRIAAQIASGLDAAHEKNIVHRDIKSGNVMLTSKGDAKVLDFGLAQTAQSTKLTRMGSTLGTVAYMSPEQARGEEVDGRSDLYSLGTVLYEMIAGRLPFSAEYEQAAIYSILNEEPEPLTAVRTGVPMALETIVAKALRKDASLRYQTARDFIADLKALDLKSRTTSRVQAEASVSVPLTAHVAAPSGTSSTKVFRQVHLVTIVLVGIAAVMAGYFLHPAGSPASVLSPLIVRESIAGLFDARLSPDGLNVAFVADDTLWIRKLSTMDSSPVARFAQAPKGLTWSPTSRRVGFIDGDVIRSVQADGSNEIRIGRLPPSEQVTAIAWSSEDSLYIKIVFGGANSEIVTVPASGGNPASYVANRASRDSTLFNSLVWHSPTSSLLAVKIDNTLDASAIQIVKPRDEKGRSINERLMEATTSASVYNSFVLDTHGYLLLNRNNTIWAQDIEPETLAPTGTPRILMSDAMALGVGANGLLLARTGHSLGKVKMVLFEPSTARFTVVGPVESEIGFLVINPDGTRAAGLTDTMIILDLARGGTRPIQHSGTGVSQWLPDNLGITYSAYQETGGANILILDPDGVTAPRTLIGGAESEFYPALSPDRSTIMYYVADPETGRDLWTIGAKVNQGQLETEGEATPWYVGPNEDVLPSWHPSGRWILYSANHSGEYEVYLREYPSSRGEKRVSFKSGFDPRWSPDGSQIYYRDADSLFVVDVIDTGSMDLSSPRGILGFESNRILMSTQLERSYAVNPATGSLLMNQAENAEEVPGLVFITNWRALLDE